MKLVHSRKLLHECIFAVCMRVAAELTAALHYMNYMHKDVSTKVVGLTGELVSLRKEVAALSDRCLRPHSLGRSPEAVAAGVRDFEVSDYCTMCN